MNTLQFINTIKHDEHSYIPTIISQKNMEKLEEIKKNQAKKIETFINDNFNKGCVFVTSKDFYTENRDFLIQKGYEIITSNWVKSCNPPLYDYCISWDNNSHTFPGYVDNYI